MSGWTDGEPLTRSQRFVYDGVTRVVTMLDDHSRYLVVATLAVMLVLPIVSGDYMLNLYGYTLIYIIGVTGLDIVVGSIDELHLAQAPMLAIAGYGSALVVMGWNVPFVVGALVGIGLTVAFSLIVGVLGFRLVGLYFALASLALGELARLVIHNSPNITQGTLGLTGIPNVGLYGFTITTTSGYYYLALVLVVVGLAAKRNLVDSTVGDALVAVGENEQLAQSVGINTLRYKLIAFATNAVYAGVAGVLYASYTGLLVPADASLLETNDYLMMNIIGGIGTLTGPVFGAITITIVPEFFRFAEGTRILLYGLTLVVVIIYAPEGIAGILNKFRRNDR